MEFAGFNIYEIFLLLFIYVLGCIVISDQLRLRWWVSNGCTATKDSQEAHGPTGWTFWIAVIYISLITLYILYSLYNHIYDKGFTGYNEFGKFKF